MWRAFFLTYWGVGQNMCEWSIPVLENQEIAYHLVNKHRYGKSPFSIGKSSNNVQCSVSMFVYQIVTSQCNPVALWETQADWKMVVKHCKIIRKHIINMVPSQMMIWRKLRRASTREFSQDWFDSLSDSDKRAVIALVPIETLGTTKAEISLRDSPISKTSRVKAVIRQKMEKASTWKIWWRPPTPAQCPGRQPIPGHIHCPCSALGTQWWWALSCVSWNYWSAFWPTNSQTNTFSCRQVVWLRSGTSNVKRMQRRCRRVVENRVQKKAFHGKSYGLLCLTLSLYATVAFSLLVKMAANEASLFLHSPGTWHESNYFFFLILFLERPKVAKTTHVFSVLFPTPDISRWTMALG